MQISFDRQNRSEVATGLGARAQRVRDKVAADDDGQLDGSALPWMATWLVRGAYVLVSVHGWQPCSAYWWEM